MNKEETEMINGVEIRKRYFNGKLTSETEYKNGKLNGKYKEYYNDILMEVIDYKNGKMDGKQKRYNRIGLYHLELDTPENESNFYLYRESNYTDGKLNGTSTTWYYKPHTSIYWLNKIQEFLRKYNIEVENANCLLSYGSFKDNKMDGIWLSIDTAADALIICEYQDGKILNYDKVESWSSDGKIFYTTL